VSHRVVVSSRQSHSEELAAEMEGQTIKEYTYYLFDFDGTLVDTLDIISASFMHTFNKRFNVQLEPAYVRSRIGLPLVEQYRKLLAELGLPTDSVTVEESVAIHTEYQSAHWKESVRLYPGVLDVLQQLQRRGKKMAIVTSRRLPALKMYSEHLGIWDFFDSVVTPELTDEHKPHPAPAWKALELLTGVSYNSPTTPSPTEITALMPFSAPSPTCPHAQCAVFIGDALFDIDCGNAAGTDTVFVTHGAGTLESLRTQPTYIVNSLLEIVAPICPSPLMPPGAGAIV
jgi:pyrophosphatase PpaX